MHDDPLGFYTTAHQQFGDYVKIRAVLGIDCYLLTHPDAVEHVLHKNHRNYRKPDIFYNSVGLLVGDGLFTNEGDSWQQQRKLVSPAFQPAHLARLCPAILASTEAFMQTAPVDQPIDLAQAMMKLGLALSSTTLFSTDISGEADAIGKAFKIGFQHISNRMNSMQLIPNWLPTHANRRFAAAKQSLDHVVHDLIVSRQKLTEQPADLLGVMLNARDPVTGTGMSHRLMMDEILTLLTAGHENVAAALTWTWYLIAAHPAVQQELFDEINGLLHGRPISQDDLDHLPLLSAVFEESLRLYPPGWGELRETVNDDVVDGYPIPKKSMIILCQWVTHRHPEFWDAPEQFRPERFLDSATPVHRFAYFPFGGGPRICIGLQLARMECCMVIASILQKFRVELPAGQRIEPDATFTLRPRFGLQAILRRR
jgi:cytochrome P450